MTETTVVETTGGETTTGTPTGATVETVTEPIYFNGDGTFGDGWQGKLDEGLRDEPSLKGFKDVNGLAKSFVNTKSMVGKNTMAIPTDVSTEQEWEAYHVAGGRPDTVADYMLKAPDEFPAEVLEKVFPKARLEQWQERFFKSGISKKAADQFIADFAQDMMVDLQNAKNDKEALEAELIKGNTDLWGNAYDQKIHYGNMAIEEGTEGDVDFKARVVAKIQHDPDLTRFTANLGGKFSEGKPPEFSTIPTPTDYQTQIDEIQKNPLYMNGTVEQRMRLANQIMAIREKMTPKAQTTV